jgi:hypothetical protein
MTIKIYPYLSACLMTFGLATLFTSCDDYLDTVPSKGENEVLNSGKQIDALFNSSDIFNTKVSYAIASSDDINVMPEMYDQMGWMGDSYLNGYVFGIADAANAQYGDEVWESEYNKVFTANLVINEIDNVEGLTEQQRTDYLAQAHFTRALAYWNLVQTYCMPYADETKGDLGLPLKQTTSYEENVNRATLQETYDLIEADLTEAMKTSQTAIGSRWRVSVPAVQAMMARFYLFTQQYDKAADHAQKALQCPDATLQDYNELTQIEDFASNPITGDGEPVFYSELYGYAPNQMADYQENYYSQYFSVSSGNYMIPSETLLALYDQSNDLRYEQFFGHHTLWNVWVGGFGDDILYHKFYHYIYEDQLQSGPTVPEMLLTAAEALARQNQVNEAMQLVNQLRHARMRNDSEDINLTASNRDEAIQQILDERHREMPFLMRWFDIRRLAYNETTADDVTVEHVFYKVVDNVPDGQTFLRYTLPVKSRRYAIPITNLEISRSGNQIEQNSYTDHDVRTEEITDYEWTDVYEGIGGEDDWGEDWNEDWNDDYGW